MSCRTATAAALLSSCASYRVLPLPAASGASQSLPVRYEKSRLLFSSTESDGLLERVFAFGPEVLATVVQPAAGVEASTDSGASWTFAELPSQPGAPQIFREVVFDPRDPRRIWARSGPRILRSEDGGRTWRGSQPSEDTLDVLTYEGAGGLIAASRNRLFVSRDGGQTWDVRAPQLGAREWRARNIVSSPVDRGTVWMSVRSLQPPPEPGKDLFARFVALLRYSSDDAVAALRLVDARDEAPRQIAWGAAGGDGVYVSHDGGVTFRRTGLLLDAFIAMYGGALYALAADPILQAAALIRHFPDLASLAERHMQGDRIDSAGLRAACRYPGRMQLLMGPAATGVVFRSQDGGASWSRVVDPPLELALALRDAVERSSWNPGALRPAPREAPRRPAPRPQRGAPETAGRSEGLQAPPQRMPRVFAPNVSADTLLSFVDPARLLAHFNAGMALSGIASGAAYVATERFWDALTAAMAEASADEGEISLGPGRVQPQPGPAFDLLSRTGAALVEQHFELPPNAPGIVPFPDSIATGDRQAFMVLGGRDRRGQTFRAGFRTSLTR